MEQKLITRLYHCQYLRLTQESYPLSHYAKHHLTQNLVVKNLLVKNLVAQISDNRIYNRATDGKRTLDHLNAMLSPTIEHNPIFDKTRPVQLSTNQYNRQ
ncbi:hypothetical protein A9299_02765 [Moraxella osloensis]|uniref:Uncharacterized protein n=1 Tax=Faucicola osloensis TaxID=34062 RepID=A0AA91FJS1_FAUOS|nr:hypothetical protein [Moraxella osloensis]OBX62158.1 hypothetical protein A9299_02765 [Moraxella osloensis]